MFYCLTGKVIASDAVSVALECGGVGFLCNTSMNTLKHIGGIGETVTLYTHLNVREDALDLFGFYTNAELNCFRELITVSGVGPKAAIAVLSVLPPERLALAVATGDVKSITQAQGVGPKLAQRMVMELKDKLAKGIATGIDFSQAQAAGVASASGSTAEAVSALAVLGYSQSEAASVVARLDSTLPVEELIRQALKLLMKL